MRERAELIGLRIAVFRLSVSFGKPLFELLCLFIHLTPIQNGFYSGMLWLIHQRKNLLLVAGNSAPW
jgi:hypothetical protein